MTEYLHIRPDPRRRVAFARWAVAQRPKLRTIDAAATFAVPPELFTRAPEDILIGSYVNGHRYVSPVEDAAEGRPEPGAPAPPGLVLVGESAPETAVSVVGHRYVSPGEAALPPVPEEGYGPDAVPLPGAPEEASRVVAAPGALVVVGEDGPAPSTLPGPAAFACDLCDRTFASERGRDSHRRQIHPEG